MSERIKELIQILNRASHAYYNEDTEILSNLEYDNLYDELTKLESDTGIIYANSPTQKVGFEVVGSLQKVPHETPLLSLDKTKESDALMSFLGSHNGLLSWKLDGLRIVLKYVNGQLSQALTRGNGVIGEDVTHNAKFFRNIPLTLPHKGTFLIQGEAVIKNSDFEAIIKTEDYKNPRNLCSGTVRQLSSETAAKRPIYFYAFSLINSTDFTSKIEQLKWIKSQGFDPVEHYPVDSDSLLNILNDFKNKLNTTDVASDGLVLTFDNIEYSISLGSTSKFPRDSMAFKWSDEIVSTELINIEWSTSRTGLVNPIAVFNPIEIEGTTVSRASVHNVSILKTLELFPGDTISVYKANMIIPQISENHSKTGNREVLIPNECPVCGSAAKITGDPETLYCTGDNCLAQRIGLLTHFVSRDAMNITGLSEQTLEKLISNNIISNYTDLFNLEQHKNLIVSLDGFGTRLYEKLVESINTAKTLPLANFIYSLGIKHVGLQNAKLLCSSLSNDAEKIKETCKSESYDFALSNIKGFGEAISNSLHEYFSHEANVKLFDKTVEMLTFTESNTGNKLNGLTFVITGSLVQFENRKKLQEYIESNGGNVSGSISANTSYLINNDAASTSSKNKKAKELGVAVITEDEFMGMVAD